MKAAAIIAAAVLTGALPYLTGSNYIIGIAVSACIFTVSAAALNLVYGFTGLLSFAQLGFWGIGGYAAALTVVTIGGNFWQGLFLAGLINAVSAVGSSSVFKKALAPLALSDSAPSMTPTL